jgi:hypothetical protein
MNIRKIAWLAAVPALAAGAAFAAVPAAQATTLTCTHTAGATTSPIGCGGIQSATTAHGMLDMAVLGSGGVNGNFFNSPVGVLTDSQSQVREDFTVFAVNGHITGGPGDLGVYVAMYTPNGRVASFTGTVGGVTGTYTNAVPDAGTNFTVGSNVYCISVVSQHNGPGGAARWNAVLRNCNSNGTFTMGNDGTIENSVTSSHANAYQVWAPVTGANGLLFVNESLSHSFHHGNTQYVLDIKGSGGSGSRLLAFPENDGLNQEWQLIGCTHPADVLSTGYQFCP